MSTKILKLAFLICYVHDYHESYKFYSGVLGLKKTNQFSPYACFFRIGENDWGLFMEAGYRKRAYNKNTGCSFNLCVKSAGLAYKKFQKLGVPILGDGVVDMGNDNYWFQIMDPSNNVLNILGGK